ncbi:MAG: hypothetical protein RLY78_2233 [Pseudomonadota bacterium]
MTGRPSAPSPPERRTTMSLPLTPALRHPLRATAIALSLSLAGLAVHAETSPYYLGVATTLSHDSNLYRRSDGSGQVVGDTVWAQALVAGLDQTLGRQRLSGTATLRRNDYSKLDTLDYTGHNLKLALDWETVNNLSGTVGVSSARGLRRVDTTNSLGQPISEQYVQNDRSVNASVRLGVITRMTLEAGIVQARTGYSYAAYDRANATRQRTLSVASRYQLGGATQVGIGLRQGRVVYPSVSGNDYDRRDIDLTVNWRPSGLSTVYGRFSHSRTEHDAAAARTTDFSGPTWELRGDTQVTGKLKLAASLSRDTGIATSTYSLTSRSENFSRASTNIGLDANFALTSKIALRAGLDLSRRDLERLATSTSNLSGKDDTRTLSLGASWQPTRSITLACDLSHEQRSVSGNASLPYSADVYSCNGQFVLGR